jgi:hypothetical protein
MEELIRKIEIRIETNEECMGNFNAPDYVNDMLKSENDFLREIVAEIQTK